MDKHNNLNVALLTNKCNEAIHNLNQDIEDNEMVLTNLQNIVAEERLSGEAISAFKNMLADYYAVTKLNVEADGMIHTMAITVETEVDPNTHETHKYLVRHNDFKNQNGFTRVEYTPENLEKLMTEYRDGSVHGNDGIKITGVSRE